MICRDVGWEVTASGPSCPLSCANCPFHRPPSVLCDPSLCPLDDLVEKKPCLGTSPRICECRAGMFCATSASNSCARCFPHSVCPPGMVVKFPGKYPTPSLARDLCPHCTSPANLQMTLHLPRPPCGTDHSSFQDDAISAPGTSAPVSLPFPCVPGSERPWGLEAQAWLQEVLGWFETRGKGSRGQEKKLKSLSWEIPGSERSKRLGTRLDRKLAFFSNLLCDLRQLPYFLWASVKEGQVAREEIKATGPVWVAWRGPFRREAWGGGGFWTTAQKRCHCHRGSEGAVSAGDESARDLVLLQSLPPPLLPLPPPLPVLPAGPATTPTDFASQFAPLLSPQFLPMAGNPQLPLQNYIIFCVCLPHISKNNKYIFM